MLGRWLGEPETYSGVHLAIDPLRKVELYGAVERLPMAVSVELRRAALASYAAMSDPAVECIRYIELVFAVVIAFGVVFSTARIIVAERGRELATERNCKAWTLGRAALRCRLSTGIPRRSPLRSRMGP